MLATAALFVFKLSAGTVIVLMTIIALSFFLGAIFG